MTWTSLSGTADAPLDATVSYTFFLRPVTEGGVGLGIPYVRRGSWDDVGVPDRPEQEAFVEDLLRALGVPLARPDGDWRLGDRADAVRDALLARLAPPVTPAPEAPIDLAVPPDRGRDALARLAPCALRLVARVLGVGPFVPVSSAISGDEPPVREDVWRAGDLVAGARAEAGGGMGVSGEAWTLSAPAAGARRVTLWASLDVRLGGRVGGAVAGVRDARALADAFARDLLGP